MTPSAKPKESTDQFVEMITLQDRPVLLRHERLDLSAVHLDPANQRVQFLLSGRAAEAGEQEIADLVWERPATKALSRAIKATGGLIESIIVKGDTVVEGNCRLVCYRKLREQDPENPRWETIPARLLPDDITDQQIAMLLGDFHVLARTSGLCLSRRRMCTACTTKWRIRRSSWPSICAAQNRTSTSFSTPTRS